MMKNIEDQILYQEESYQYPHNNSFWDSLTGLPNRKLLLQDLKNNIIYSSEHANIFFSLLILDIDHFKVVNNSLGILIGDQLLIQVAKRLEKLMRSNDQVIRLGGDEFAVILNNLRSIDSIFKISARIHERLMSPFHLNGCEIFINTSMGITHNNVSCGNAEDFLRDADTAMNYAKSAGRSCYVMFQTEMHKSAVHRLNLGNSLRQALKQNEFFLEYQPIVSLFEDQLIGFEALIRWNHPENGIIKPVDFISTAEEIGLINSIGQWVLKEACQQMKAWQIQFESMNDLTISVNLSAKQIFDEDLLDLVKNVLLESKLDPCCLKLEVTESILLEDTPRIMTVLEDIHALGVQIAIDDFGTGYSSLSYLIKFPFDTLKLDSSFTRDIEKDYKKFSLVKGLLALSQDLDMKVVAEGLETTDQLAQLKALGCIYGQGYLFSKSLSPKKVQNYVDLNFAEYQCGQDISPCLSPRKVDFSQDKKVAKDQLLIEIENLKLELESVEQEKRDLEIILDMTTNHAEVIESELQHEITNHHKTELNLQLANRRLQKLSYIDSLTQIANRRFFDEYLAQEWESAIRTQESIALILADVDFFKLFNDEYGHCSGDSCLVQVAQALSEATDLPEYLSARYGGEEFGVILPGTTSEKAVEVAEKIRLAVKKLKIPNAKSPVSKYVTISLGVVSTVPFEMGFLNNFIVLADKALYSAKNQGRNCLDLFRCAGNNGTVNPESPELGEDYPINKL